MSAINKLSDKSIKALRPQKHTYKRGDGDKLWLYVTPAGSKIWRILWFVNKKEKQFTVGEYPAISLKDARGIRDEVNKLLVRGLDPNEEKARAQQQAEDESRRQALTFRTVAMEWYDTQTGSNCTKTRQGILGRLHKHVFPYIGDKQITEVSFDDLRSIVRRIEGMRMSDLPLRVANILTRICRFVKVNRYTETNIAEDLTSILDVRLRKIRTPRPAILDPDAVGDLLRRIDEYGIKGSPQMYAAIRLMPYVALRNGELVGGRWEEIDWERRLWHIPAERMKMRRPHTVPLSRQCMEILKELRNFSTGEYMFPSRGRGTHISREGLERVLPSIGIDPKKMSIHGFRSIFRSLGMENDFPEHLIEKQLAHINADKTIAAYDRADYLEKRHDMMQR